MKRLPRVRFHRSNAPTWSGRRHERARSNRGVAVVEAAFVTPIFFALVLGVIELGLIMNNYLGLAHSVRAGARVASASGNEIFADYGIMASVKREAAALGDDQIQLVVVYKAEAFGSAPTATCQGGTSVVGVCNVYTPADLALPKEDWGCRPDRNIDRYWCPTTRKVTLTGDGTEFVGVWMKIEHDWVTKLFGSTTTLTDSSVIRLEPRAQI